MVRDQPEWTWDKEVRAGYILLSDEPVVSTIESMPGLNVDLDKDCNIVGIEVL